MVATSCPRFFARYIFYHPAETAGKNLEVASDYLAWADLAAAFTKVTGLGYVGGTKFVYDANNYLVLRGCLKSPGSYEASA
jgi:hypothetical protein